jgi:hypothetical protein
MDGERKQRPMLLPAYKHFVDGNAVALTSSAGVTWAADYLLQQESVC